MPSTRQTTAAIGDRRVGAAGEEPDGDAGEQGAVGHPVQGGVQEVAPPAAALLHPGHDAVDDVGEDERRDEHGAPPELAERVEHQGADHDAERADDGHGVRGDTDPQQPAGKRGEQGGEETAGVPVKHPSPRLLLLRIRAGISCGQASATCWRTSPRVCVIALVWAMIGKKFPSPPQRGTTCWCRWPAMPAPPVTPWFMPRLKPVGLATLRSTRMAVWVSSANSAVSSTVRSV